MPGYKWINFDVSNRLFSAVMGSGRSYSIPRFQRGYSWDTEEWQELWNDIECMREKKEQHFMGFLLLQTDNDNAFQIVDGQQRLTTLSIIILAIMRRLQALINQGQDKEINQRRLDNCRRTYTVVFNPVTVTPSPKLELNRHNNRHFQELINQLAVKPQRNVLYTNHLLSKAFEYFSGLLANIKNGEELARIIEAIASGLTFTVITVDDDINAYTIFETLNARGVHLSTSDLLKTYLLSVMAGSDKFVDDDFDDFDERWAGVLEQLGETGFTNFLCRQQGMEARLPGKRELYRLLKSTIDHPDTVFPYLKKLEVAVPVYAALQRPDDDFWRREGRGQYQEAKIQLEVLSLFNIKTPLSLLMAGYFQFTARDFLTLLQYVVAVTVRYNVIGRKSPNEQEQLYSRISNQVCTGLSVSEVAVQLGSIYPNDEEFENSFAVKSMPSKQSPGRILFLLRAIEKQLSNNEPPLSLTLEHILPYHPDDTWQEYFDRQSVEQSVDRLGNMALLPENQNMGQESFAEKRAVLQSSPYHINQHIAEYSEWDPSMLADHQKWLAKQATTVWKISQLEKK